MKKPLYTDFEELSPMEQRVLAKQVFGTPEGQLVLSHLLYITGWTKQLTRVPTADEVSTDILRLLGYFDPSNRLTVMRQIAGLDNVTYPTRMNLQESEDDEGVSPESSGRGEQP